MCLVNMIRKLISYSDDILLVAGCVSILCGLLQWSIPVTLIVAGLMLIGFGVLIGKARAKNADQ
jgi:hypothetical protein